MRRPSPVCEYPSDNMYAVKTSHTVAFANPLRAQAVESAGVSRTIWKAPPTTRPTSPTAAAGIGSAMIPAMTVANSAKYRHAPGESPSGAGITAMVAPTASGISTRIATSRRLDGGATDGTITAALVLIRASTAHAPIRGSFCPARR